MKPARRIAFLVSAIASVLLASASQSHAKQDYINYGVGIFDVTDGYHQTGELRLEYKASDQWYGIGYQVGLNMSSRESTYWFAGFNYDWTIWNGLFVSPNVSIGYYDQGDGKDLGGPREFRSAIDLGWEFENAHRLSFTLSHISNARLYDKNPGQETIAVVYSLPITPFWKK